MSTYVAGDQQQLQATLSSWTSKGWHVESQVGTNLIMVKGQRPNHILHLILSIITAGLWIPVWILITLTGGEKHATIQAPSA